MSTAANQLDEFQLEIFHRVKSDPLLRQVAIIKQELGDIEGEILKNLGALTENSEGKIGACLLVMRTRAEVQHSNAMAPTFDLVTQVRVLEMPAFNRGDQGTGVTHTALATRVLRVLWHYLPKGVAGICLADKDAIEPYDADAASGIIGWDVKARVQGGIATGDKVSTPIISGTAGAVGLSCATPDATIRYTLDGSAPCSGNPLAVTYAGPFAVEAGVTIRAGAEAADLVPSDAAFRKFN